MLVEFSVENYRSIGEKQTLSMVSYEPQKLHSANLQLFSSAAIYGANASGKTNFLKAMCALKKLIIDSAFNHLDISSAYFPFRLAGGKWLNKPTRFYLIFNVDRRRYDYLISFDKSKIHEEILYLTHAQGNDEKCHICFERKAASTQQFLLLTERDEPKIKTAFRYIVSKLFVEFDRTTVDVLSEDFSLKTDVIKLLNLADDSIVDFCQNPRDGIIDFTRKSILQKLTLTTIYNNESEGIVRLFDMAGNWLLALKNGWTILIDNKFKDFHPVLARNLVKMFDDPEVNKNNAQLIFTTHDINFLEHFDKSRIWFVENNDGSKIYSLLDFATRKNESLQKGYLLGRYGAIPF
ncbi:MAG: ATP-binding protein [Oscillatoria sp. SIO1A7]|nr:ATP-binding protein [Oscillatoria sp. SIO1A7]